ncbi:hypothetical protein RHMOL_Rhmol11G0094300 [Rhododendron molle]|uniref:Uncharacterized protein n=1 Tax=Rhododendron molle TaxID=49168 RepID=A0ACC0LQN6_RHOML|nr:hypothetical protein RHMOL_Rhmol11G0094300 [Rhododendron molle]
MLIMRRRFACCSRDRELSFDFDEQERIMTYNGLESCILNNHAYETESPTSRGDGCVSDSLDEDASSCSSSNNATGSYSSHWTMMKRDEQGLDEWEIAESAKQFYCKEKPIQSLQFSDVEAMKERFAKLLLGEDVTGGHKGLPTALALSNAITNLAASIFGELWKLEPLPEDRKSKWRREMDWLLSPTNYMVELVPATQHGANGRTMESGKACLGEEFYRILSAESVSAEEMLNSLSLKSEHNALEAVNRLEAAVLAWKERIIEQACGKSPVRTSWSFIKDPISDLDKMEFLLDQAEALIQQLKTRYPNLAQTFLDVVKVKYGKDVGHSIVEAYSRALQNLAFKILTRMGDILREDVLSNPNSPVPTGCFPGMNLSDSPVHSQRVRHSLIDQMNKVDGEFCNAEIKSSPVTATPSRNRVWCIGREACSAVSPPDSP